MLKKNFKKGWPYINRYDFIFPRILTFSTDKIKPRIRMGTKITNFKTYIADLQTHTHTHTHIYIYVCVCVCVCDISYTFSEMVVIRVPNVTKTHIIIHHHHHKQGRRTSVNIVPSHCPSSCPAGGVRLHLSGNAKSSRRIFLFQATDKWIWSNRGMTTDRRSRWSWRKTCQREIISTVAPTRSARDMKLGIRVGDPVTDSFICDTVVQPSVIQEQNYVLFYVLGRQWVKSEIMASTGERWSRTDGVLLRQDWWRERELNGVRWLRWSVHFFII